MKRRQLLAAATATVSAVAGCTGDGGDGNDGGGQQQAGDGDSGADVAIAMEDTAFGTLQATVETGATVEWVNEDGTEHTVTSAQFHDAATEWSFDERVPADGSVTYTFEAEGVYEYACTIHGKGTMCGAVLVGGATLAQSLPCSGDDGSGGGGGGGGYY